MKKIVFAALVATVFATPAFAQGRPGPGNDSDSASTEIAGQIALSCTIDAPANYNILDLNSAAEQEIGDVSLACNSINGYTVTASSANGGKLTQSGTSTNFAYTVGSTGVPFTSLASAATLPVAGANSGQIALSLPVIVKVGTRTGAAYAGVYADTINLAIQAN